MTPELTLSANADMKQVAAVVSAFEHWAELARLPYKATFAAKLAIEELVVNAVTHGAKGTDGTIRLVARRRPRHVEIEIRDSAPAFDPFDVPPPRVDVSIEQRKIGGLGIHIVRTLMDEWGYAREGNENVIRLCKRFEDGAAAPHCGA